VLAPELLALVLAPELLALALALALLALELLAPSSPPTPEARHPVVSRGSSTPGRPTRPLDA